MAKDTFLKVKYDGVEYELDQPSTKHLVFLERQFGVSASELGDNARLEYMVFLAWAALKGRGVPVGKYGDDFLDKIELTAEEAKEAGVEFVLEEDVQVPTGAEKAPHTD